MLMQWALGRERLPQKASLKWSFGQTCSWKGSTAVQHVCRSAQVQLKKGAAQVTDMVQHKPHNMDQFILVLPALTAAS